MVSLYIPRGYRNDPTLYSMAIDADTQLTPHFKVREFACKDGSDEVLIDLSLVYFLEDLRVYYNAPISITSGYRTPDYNERVGGSANSKHMKGEAADIVVHSVPPLKVFNDLNPVHTGGLGMYREFTHIDVRGVKARW